MAMKSLAAFGTIMAAVWAMGAHAADYPTESRFRQALAGVERLVRAEGMRLEVLNAQDEGLTRPLLAAGFNIDSSTCIVFFNTRPEDGLTQFFASISERELPPLLRAMAVHEVTHCVEQRERCV